jgi:hypothetical protein
MQAERIGRRQSEVEMPSSHRLTPQNPAQEYDQLINRLTTSLPPIEVAGPLP